MRIVKSERRIKAELWEGVRTQLKLGGWHMNGDGQVYTTNDSRTWEYLCDVTEVVVSVGTQVRVTLSTGLLFVRDEVRAVGVYLESLGMHVTVETGA